MKNLQLLILLLLLLPFSLFAEEVYKATDASGNTIYSDQPLEGGHTIDIKPVQTYSPPPVPQQTTPPTAEKPAAKEVINYTVSISKPTDQEVFINVVENIEVVLSLEPQLQENDEIQIYLNDQLYGLSHSPTFQLQKLARGAYKLKAQIVAKSDPKAVKGTSNNITFYQQRAMVRPGP